MSVEKIIHDTFINYKRFRWLWITLTFLCLATVVYVLDRPPGGRNGGTFVGYVYGTIAAALVVWLMAYGLRKRAYSSNLGTLQGWLAAHVWIGIGLLLLVPLHSGFSFGINVHNLAYVAMAITIVSGIWGAANYATLSGKITAHRGGASDSAILEQVFDLTQQIERVCAAKSEAFLAILNRFDFTFTPGLKSLLRITPIPAVDHISAGTMVADLPEGERGDAINLLGLMDRRADLTRALLEQVRIKALLKIWLFVHVPASVVLCVALAIHIISVFFFW
jgi:hypothetical protein